MRVPSPPTVIAAILLLGTLLQLSPTAHAQWKWRDDLGRTHYSDQPPPPNVPASRIMTLPAKGAAPTPTPAPVPAGADSPEANAAPTKASPPVQAATAQPGGDAAAGSSADAPKASAGPKTLAERALEMRRREAQRQADQRKEEDLARQAAARGQVCEGMRAEARTLESGMRIGRVNAQGEREIITDEERAARLQALRKDLQANCSAS